jgi:cysteine desulfurase
MTVIYFDNNATTQPSPGVVAAMTDALRDTWHNPSSVHRPGQASRRQVELAREQVAQLLGCRDRDVVFTSGGTEADNTAIIGSLHAQPDRHVIVTTRTEHEAIRDTAEFCQVIGSEVVWLQLDDHGCVDLEALTALLTARASEIAVVSVMWANNETGIIQPIEAIGNICREHGVRFHTDAVQWVGKMPTTVSDLPVDLLSFSAHKFHGPKGVGGLYIRRGVRIQPRSLGGSQERDRRGGTENTPGIRGLGAAAAEAHAWLDDPANRDAQQALRDRFEQSMLQRLDGVQVIGAQAPRIWNTANLAFERIESEALLLLLSERGMCASAGAACSSGSLDPSPVLLALGIDPILAHGAVRFSIARHTTSDEVDAAVELVCSAVEKLRGSMAAINRG